MDDDVVDLTDESVLQTMEDDLEPYYAEDDDISKDLIDMEERLSRDSSSRKFLQETRRNLDQVESELESIELQMQRLREKQLELRSRRNKLKKLLKEQEVSRDEIDWADDAFPWAQDLVEMLRKQFKLKEFRHNQREIINATMSGRDVFVIMPTGAGKSLCYQLPALLSDGITLVVSPLLALIEDQIIQLKNMHIGAEMISSTVPKQKINQIYKDMEDKNSGLKLVYVTPERITKSKMLLNKLQKIYQKKRLTRIAIDEAHCVSQWGYDFRVDYSKLHVLREQFPNTPMLALTATATGPVIADVQTSLKIEGCELFKGDFNRENLYYEVRPKSTKSKKVIEDIHQFIVSHYPKDSGIIYCFSKKEADKVCEGLNELKIAACRYHAGMTSEEREISQRQWMEEKAQVIVATIAFGMGINKSNVRFVIHHSISKSIESYYQESGRAGRDEKKAHCVIMYSRRDAARQSTMASETRNRETSLKLLYAMVRFCEDIQTCKRELLSAYFNDNLTSKCKNMCDTCGRKNVKLVNRDVTQHVLHIITILETLASMKQKVTYLHLVDIWRGTMKKIELDPLLLAPKELTIDDCERILINLILQDIVEEVFHTTAYSTIAYVGVGVEATMVKNSLKKVILPFVEDEGKTKKRVKENGNVENKSKKSKIESKPLVLDSEDEDFEGLF